MQNKNLSLWSAEVDMPRFPRLERDVKTDVLIIGGGIAGLLTAHFLHQKGIDYILVEQNRICSGTTANTTAKLTLQHGLCYHKILKSNGLEKAKGYLAANQKALNTFFELCADIDCDFTIADNYVYSVDTLAIAKELDTLGKIGCSAQFVRDLPLPLSTAGAVCVPRQAQFHPLKFLSHIAKDLHIYEHTKVRETVGNTAVTEQGKIYAQNTVIATHFPIINKHGSYFLKLYQHRSYVVALENAVKLDGMYVDDNKEGMSFRSHGDLLLLGGGGHRTGKKGGEKDSLLRFYKSHYPAAREKYSWATQDCISLDAIPYIGRYSRSTNNLYVASGFNKWGMTGAMVAAQLLCDMLTATQNEFSEVFSPSRSILKPQLLLNGAETTMNLLTPTAKRCPHLGCALKWNAAEHSWDCPCHGSRFESDGTLLDGPATGDLKK